MKAAALLLFASITVGAANAQATSEGASFAFHPMPNTLPRLLFAPDSLAGAMLEPLTPARGGQAAVGPGAPLPELPEMPADAQLSERLAQADPGPAVDPAPADDLAEAEAPDDAQPAAAAPEEPQVAAKPAGTTVYVIVENVESSSGTVNVAVCDTDFTPEGCPYKTAVPASAGFVEARFDGVPPGVYAVVGYHDVNDNDEFDKFLGVPREPYALSGAAAESLVPDFSDAVLKINQGENYVIIRMRRLGNG